MPRPDRSLAGLEVRARRRMDDPIINLAALVKDSRLAGPGRRDLLWVQGCSIGCPGCANPHYQPQVPRVRVPVSRLIRHFRARVGLIDGCSISGGEPSEQPDAVAALFCGVQAIGLSTVLYSGRVIEDLSRDERLRPLLRHTDLLIDGPYLAERADRHPWRGSSNQRFHLLSNRWTLADLAPPASSMELIITPGRVTCVGVPEHPRRRSRPAPDAPGHPPVA